MAAHENPLGQQQPHAASNIRLNTELVKKPKDLLEPTRSERFAALLDLPYPKWKEARAELNALPLASLRQIQGLRCKSAATCVGLYLL